MDSEIKEYIHRHITKFLSRENLLKKINLLQKLQKIGFVNSVEDALYGSLIESLLDITIVINVFEGYSLTSEDILELLDIIEHRSSEIKSKVLSVLTGA